MSENMNIEEMRNGYYAILFDFVSEWEEKFWKEKADKYDILVSDTAKTRISLLLLETLAAAYGNTLKHLYGKELSDENIMYVFKPEMVTEDTAFRASMRLKERIKKDPAIIYEKRSRLKTYGKRIISNHEDAIVEMLQRILEDKDEISQIMEATAGFSCITDIERGGIDFHFGGRKTCVIETDAGCFVYKPRSLKADIVLKKLADEYFPDTVAFPEAIDKGEYGYEKYFKQHTIEGLKESRVFFRRAGATLAILNMLGAKDINVENLMTNGSMPVIVDTETVLSASGIHESRLNRLTEIQKYNHENEDIRYSIKYVGLMPFYINGMELSPFISGKMESVLPVIDGKKQDLRDYWQDFEEGFRSAYRICIDRKNELTEYLSNFNDCSFRYIRIITDQYLMMMRRAYTVRALESDEISRIVLESLPYDIHTLDEKEIDTLRNAEICAAKAGDVVVFSTIGNSHDLYCGDELIVKDMWKHSPVENALFRLNRMSEKECDFELDVFKQGLECALRERDEQILQYEGDDCDSLEKLCLDTADEIFNMLLDRRLEGPSGSVCWMDTTMESAFHIQMEPGLKIGDTGIALFAAAYYKLTGSSVALEMCEQAFQSAQSLADAAYNTAKEGKNCFRYEYSDISGIMKASVLIGEYTGDSSYVETAVKLAEAISSEPDEMMKSCDYYSGIAGILSVLCSHKVFCESKSYEKTLKRLTEILINEKNPDSNGWGTIAGNRILSGLGHGQAGIGLALAMAAEILDDEACKRAAEDALCLEDQLFSDKLGTWPDLRASILPEYAMHGICSGAPGMGLVYLKLSEMGYEKAEKGLERAIRSCLKNEELMHKDHLCCGNMAAVEFLLEVGRKTGRMELIEAADNRLKKTIHRKTANGRFILSNPGFENYTNIGFLPGISGIGYTILRKLDEDICSTFI